MAQTSNIDPRFMLSTGVLAGRRVWPHVPESGEPRFRPLRILVLDPSAKKLEGRETVAQVPYEKLSSAFVDGAEATEEAPPDDENSGWRSKKSLRLNGCLFKIYSKEEVKLDLNDYNIAMRSGVEVNRGDCGFRIQMVYAVCSLVYRAFQSALGRDPEWAVRRVTDRRKADISRGAWCLDVIIDLFDDRANAYYDSSEVALKLGSFRSKNSMSGVDDQIIYASLSNDIVTHEVTHALLDGMRSLLMRPTNPEVAGFHEGFADLVAVFQRFEFSDLLRVCAEQAGWGLLDHPLLTRIGKEFGHGLGDGDGIRNAVEVGRQEKAMEGIFAPGAWLRYVDTEVEGYSTFEEHLECHAMGEVLLRAVYDGFRIAFKRRVSRLAAIVGGNRAESSEWMSSELKDALAEESAKTARHFKDMLIRAIDYLPPVDVTFSDYLRALVTADMEMVDDDKFDYRGAIIESFVKRGIKPRGVSGLSPAELKWRAVKDTGYGNLIKQWSVTGLTWQSEWSREPSEHDEEGHQQKSKQQEEKVVQDRYTWGDHKKKSKLQGEKVVDGILNFVGLGGSDEEESLWESLGLFNPGIRTRTKDGLTIRKVGKVTVESVRHARRVASSGRLVVDTIIELSQSVRGEIDRQKMEMCGGVTVILDDMGSLRYAIRKSVRKPNSWRRMLKFSRKGGMRFWEVKKGGYLKPCDDLVSRIHSE